ncbi:NCS2 family permease [Thermoflavimicrobium dichotomicum]|uniref:Putative MFS transporter, AGZA family, xanthine/uracil permease n=1 Tax=Thermoflavimicrobium dichotomicum TaxID=46223 RepID=A0A1I3RKJ5_9BACL|nr:NCS2 family permease [Thermoflavimicrobium dichotomicum]SFJ45686.1 putative MFS transporter, AGZA family, xanthine/uracil permease [Thermoflavimicrobium dichotomicum]
MFTIDKNTPFSWKKEIFAGLTTFFTMAYIMVVNPIILSDAGIPFQQSFMATIISTIVGSLLMGMFAKYPIAIAPAMGLNAYFAYSVVKAHAGISYQAALAAVFVMGIIFVILSLTPLRTKLIEAIPDNLKHAITAGIGLFIAFIGMRMSGLIKDHPTNLVALGDLHSPSVILTLIGLFITLICMSLNIPAALFIGMVGTGIIAYLTGQLQFSKGFVAVPSLPEPVVINPIQAVSDVIHYGLYAAVFSFLLVTIFDTTGTFLGVSKQAGLVKDGKTPNSSRAMLSDSIATLVGSVFGTSPTSAYIESASGVAAGGRTGLTAVVVAGLFAISAFFSPLIGAVTSIAAITSPALIIVGSLMISHVRHLDWDRFEESFPAFLVILSMPLTSSIATGIALGFISYPILKILKRQWKEVHPLVYIFAVLFVIQLIFMPH